MTRRQPIIGEDSGDVVVGGHKGRRMEGVVACWIPMEGSLKRKLSWMEMGGGSLDGAAVMNVPLFDLVINELI